MVAYKRDFIDFAFRFSNTAAGAGTVVRTGQVTDYFWEAENQTGATAYTLANDEVMDVEGLEIIQNPLIGNRNYGAYRVPIKYVRLIIDGNENDRVNFNELMAPAKVSGFPSYGTPDFYDGMHCVNLGRSMLAGSNPQDTGMPWGACPKVGQGESLDVTEFEVVCYLANYKDVESR